jgi:hypothetical protein
LIDLIHTDVIGLITPSIPTAWAPLASAYCAATNIHVHTSAAPNNTALISICQLTVGLPIQYL